MVIFLTVLLLVCVLGVLHTYLLYPWWVTRGKGSHAHFQARSQVPSPDDNSRPGSRWPPVAVLMAVHNEATVLEQKLRTLVEQEYPGPLTIHVGSDNSSDATNDILRDWAAREPRLQPVYFTSRQGKPGIVNQLAAALPPHPATVLLLTDASVMLRPNVVTELIRPMIADPSVGVVDATMVQTGGRASGIGRAEERYISREVAVKRAEGRRWGYMIGPFGGCWALRATAFRPVPDNFLVDDFYLCLAAYEQGFHGLSSPTAVVEEAVGQTIGGEFRRKVRIGSGNWQNLVRFRRLWWPVCRNELSFAFFSHKVLRWWTPFLLLIGAVCVVLLLLTLGPESNYWVRLLLLLPAALLGGLAMLDLLLSTVGLHWRPARTVRYFLAMNAALLVGFWRYLTGISSNVWQPTLRE